MSHYPKMPKDESNMDKMKVFCIIPVYNVTRYLAKCVNSVLRQTYQNVEIILINDASTDNSKLICTDFQAKYSDKIHFIDKSRNEGVDKARFTGLDYLLNNYIDGGIMFIDSDDWLEEKAIELSVNAMTENNSDIVEMRANRVHAFIKKPYFSPIVPQTITQPTLFEKYYISFFGVNLLGISMWSKLYKLQTLRNVKLSPSGFKMGEDLMFNLKLFPFLQTYTLIDYRGYNYRVGGLTSHYNPTLWHDLKNQHLIKREEATLHNYTQAYRTLAIELKNIFNSEITQRIFWKQESDEKLIKWIRGVLNEDILWQDLRNELSDSTDSIIQNIINKNAEGILKDVREQMKRNRNRFFVKRLLMKLLK